MSAPELMEVAGAATPTRRSTGCACITSRPASSFAVVVFPDPGRPSNETIRGAPQDLLYYPSAAAALNQDCHLFDSLDPSALALDVAGLATIKAGPTLIVSNPAFTHASFSSRLSHKPPARRCALISGLFRD